MKFLGILLVYSAILTNSLSSVQVDLVFVVDESGSIEPHEFKQSVAFVEKVVDGLNSPIGPLDTQIGQVSFASDAKAVRIVDSVDSKFKMSSTKRSDIGVSTNTAAGISAARNIKGVRNYHPYQKIMIVLTDGNSNDRKQTAENAKKAHAEDWIVFVVGVGDGINQSELEAIASDKKYIFNVHDFVLLKDKVQDIAKLVIDIRPPPEYDLEKMATAVNTKNKASIVFGYKNMAHKTEDLYRASRIMMSIR